MRALLASVGFDEEARDFVRFFTELCRKDPRLQIMYGVGGEKDLTERTLDHLECRDNAKSASGIQREIDMAKGGQTGVAMAVRGGHVLTNVPHVQELQVGSG